MMACSTAGSLMLFITTFAFAVVATLTTQLMENSEQMKSFLFWLPDMVLALLMTCSIATMIGLMCFTECSDQSGHHNETMRTWLEVNMKLIGLVLFFIAFVFLEVMGVAADYSCNDELFQACDESTLIPSSRSLSLFRHLVQIAWAVAAVSFCHKFREHPFVRSTATLISFGLMASTTLALWANYLIPETTGYADYKSHNATTDPLIGKCRRNSTLLDMNTVSPDNSTPINETEWFRCLIRQTELYQFVKDCGPYLTPCSVEFLLLFTECIAAWFFSSLADKHNHQLNNGNKKQETQTERNETQHGDIGRRFEEDRGVNSSIADDMHHSTNADENRETVVKHVYSEDEENQQIIVEPDGGDQEIRANYGKVVELGVVGNEARVDINGSTDGGIIHSEGDRLIVNEESHHHGNHAVSQRCEIDRFPWYAFSALITIILNVLYVAASILAFSASSENDRRHYRNIFYGYRIGYWIILSSSIIVGYKSTRKFITTTTVESNPTGFEYFVVLCSFGPMFYFAFSFIANLGTPSDDPPTILYLFEQIFNLAEVIGQTIFYFFVKHVCDAMRKLPEEEKKQATFLKAVLTSFIISNFALWAQDSFVETRNIDKSFQQQFFREWENIYGILNPLLLMYRFNSFIVFAEVRLTTI